MIEQEVKKFTRQLLKRQRELRQIYSYINPPHGNLLNMMANTSFFLSHLKMNFAPAIKKYIKHIDMLSRDARVMMSSFDALMVDETQEYIMNMVGKDINIDTCDELYDKFDVKAINDFIQKMYDNLDNIKGMDNWMRDGVEYVDGVNQYMLDKFSGTDLYFQIKTLIYYLVCNPVLMPIIPIIQVREDFDDLDGEDL